MGYTGMTEGLARRDELRTFADGRDRTVGCRMEDHSARGPSAHLTVVATEGSWSPAAWSMADWRTPSPARTRRWRRSGRARR